MSEEYPKDIALGDPNSDFRSRIRVQDDPHRDDQYKKVTGELRAVAAKFAGKGPHGNSGWGYNGSPTSNPKVRG